MLVFCFSHFLFFLPLDLSVLRLIGKSYIHACHQPPSLFALSTLPYTVFSVACYTFGLSITSYRLSSQSHQQQLVRDHQYLPPSLSLSFLSISQMSQNIHVLGLQLTLTFPIYLSIIIYLSIYLSICLSGCLSWLRGCRWVGGGGAGHYEHNIYLSVCLSFYHPCVLLYPCPSTLCSPSVGLRAWLMERWRCEGLFFHTVHGSLVRMLFCCPGVLFSETDKNV